MWKHVMSKKEDPKSNTLIKKTQNVETRYV